MGFLRAGLPLLLLLGGCATAPVPAPSPESGPAPFSAADPGDALPAGWQPYRLMRLKKLTQYRLVSDEGQVVLQAVADGSASGMRYGLSVDLRETPWLEWSWKVSRNVVGARNSPTHIEDSPARVIVAFAGSREDLPADEQMNYDLALAMSGNRMPFATIMYVWENTLPAGEVITHHFSSRVKMIVAGAAGKSVGSWHRERHNLYEDYRRVFGAEPPRVVSVGVMSDSDNSSSHVIAYFGDIRFRRE